MSQKSKIVALH